MVCDTFCKTICSWRNCSRSFKKCRKLNQKGFKATIDILGEHVLSRSFAKNNQSLLQFIPKINDANLNCTISVKPSHIGLNISFSEALENMKIISKQAKELNNFLRIDMENSDLTDQTFKLLNECKNITKDIGVALQAYLFRSLDDIDTLADSEFNARICKGIYKEDSSVAFSNRSDIKNNFMSMAKSMAKKGSFAGYATHDQKLIDELLSWIQSEKYLMSNLNFKLFMACL